MAKDKLILGPPAKDSGYSFCVRTREDKAELGLVKRLKEGEPIHGEVVRLRGEAPVFDVESTGVDTSGPPKVTTPAYRQGWDRIFGGEMPVGEA